MSSTTALAIARNQLHTANIPLILRISYYLRISCLRLNSKTTRYSRLMDALVMQNPNWLATCVVTPMGTVESSDRTINALLHPITTLHLADQCRRQSFPMAA